MCLGPEFFDRREEMIRTREAKGILEIEHFMRSNKLRFDLLYELGYFETGMEAPNTADVFLNPVSKAAKGFFQENRGLQLVFVRTKTEAKLDSRLRRGILASDQVDQ